MKKTKIKNKVEYYLNLPYEFIIIPEESGGFSIKVKEFEYCSGFGETLEEAWESIKESMRIWIEDVLEKGMEIPLPESMKEYSGKFVVRLPKYLHRKLSKLAEKEGVSLNQLVVSLLSEKVGMKEVENKILNKFEEIVNLLKRNKETIKAKAKI